MLAPPNVERAAPLFATGNGSLKNDWLGGSIGKEDKPNTPRSQAKRLLTAPEEKDLAQRSAAGDIAARNRLVTSHAPLVEKIASRFKRPSVQWDDLISEGNLGLLRATETFDPERGVRFSAYASWWVKASISQFVKRSQSVVKQDSRLSYENDLSLNERISYEDGEKEERIERLEDLSPRDPWQRISSSRNAEELAELALAPLTERERFVFEARHLKDEPQTLNEVGAELGVSRERARQIEATAIKKAQDAVEPALKALDDTRKGRWRDSSCGRRDREAERFLDEYYRYCTRRAKKSRAGK